MLTHVSTNSTRRLREVRSYLQMIKKLGSKTSPLTFVKEVAVAKGLFFVHLYGAYEFTVTSTVQEAILVINSSGYKIADCEPVLFSMVLHPECDALAGVGRSKTWDRRRKVFERTGSTEPIYINDSVLPTDGHNLRFSQLESIWRTFSVQAPVLPRMIMKGRLEELVTNRNHIAHGTEAAADIGGRYSMNDLDKRYKDINELCAYVISTFEQHLVDEDYIR